MHYKTLILQSINIVLTLTSLFILWFIYDKANNIFKELKNNFSTKNDGSADKPEKNNFNEVIGVQDNNNGKALKKDSETSNNNPEKPTLNNIGGVSQPPLSPPVDPQQTVSKNKNETKEHFINNSNLNEGNKKCNICDQHLEKYKDCAGGIKCEKCGRTCVFDIPQNQIDKSEIKGVVNPNDENPSDLTKGSGIPPTDPSIPPATTTQCNDTTS